MKYKIYKILFVFAILFANIAPAPAAMTLDEYWKTPNMWNGWYEDKVNQKNVLWNIDCSTSKNECCTFITDSKEDDLKKLSVDAYYPKTTTKDDAINDIAKPITCVYMPNDCFTCNFTINNNKITAECFNASNQHIYGVDDITCPPPGTDLVYKHCVEHIPNTENTIDSIDIELLNCDEYKCPDLTTENDNNQCICPDNADCSDIDDIKCRAGYYDSTPTGDTLTCTKCDAGTYCPAGSSNPIQCPAGSYCPEGASAPTTCPTPWSLSALSAKSEQECYVTLAELQYITEDKTLSVTTTDKCPEGYACPGGDVYYPNYGKVECKYHDPQEDSPENITQWLKNICPLAQSTSAITDIRLTKSWKTGAICYADMILETTCGIITKEAIPLATNEIYLTWDGTKEIGTRYYKTITAGLYATNLYTDTYCTDKPDRYQLYKNAVICPAGKYCKGYTITPQCANTNPTEYPPDGDVIAGYYSTGGAYSSTPNKSGDGCLSGHNCGKCPAGSISPAGAASCLTCPDGQYSDTDGASTCKSCTEGYFCVNGLRNECPAGSTSDEKATKITQCYIKGGDGGTGFCVNDKCFNIQSDVFYKQPSN